MQTTSGCVLCKWGLLTGAEGRRARPQCASSVEQPLRVPARVAGGHGQPTDRRARCSRIAHNEALYYPRERQLSSRDSLTARGLHTVEVARSAMYRRSSVKGKRGVCTTRTSAYLLTQARSKRHPFNKDHKAVKPSKGACAPCFVVSLLRSFSTRCWSLKWYN